MEGLMPSTSRTIDQVPDPTPRSVAQGKLLGLREYAYRLHRRARGLERRLARATTYAEFAVCDAEVERLLHARPLLIAEIGAKNESGE
jgi:hypothetical protein